MFKSSNYFYMFDRNFVFIQSYFYFTMHTKIFQLQQLLMQQVPAARRPDLPAITQANSVFCPPLGLSNAASGLFNINPTLLSQLTAPLLQQQAQALLQQQLNAQNNNQANNNNVKIEKEDDEQDEDDDDVGSDS